MILVTALLLAATVSPTARPAEPLPLAINGVWGDSSWELRFGRAPTAADAPDDRVRVHLEEVLLRLRAAPTADLAPPVAARRVSALDSLAAYIDAGVFPRNLDDPFARAEFIDHAGRLCAVGAMVAATLGPEAAEHLDATYNRDSVWAMDSAVLADWADAYGFTTNELALIQPSYSPEWFHPRTHTNHVFGARLGASVYSESEYRNSFEGLTEMGGPTPEIAGWWLWQPGLHWGLGAAVNVRANIEDYYEGQSPAVSLLLKAEYAEPIATRGVLDFLLVFEGGPVLLVSSPGDFAGLEFGGGLGLSSTLGFLHNLSFRLEVRGQHYRLWGSDSQTIHGTQVLTTLGAEWRFGL